MLRKVFANLAGPLLELSKGPDFVFNRSHHFGFEHCRRIATLGDDKRLPHRLPEHPPRPAKEGSLAYRVWKLLNMCQAEVFLAL